MSIRKAHVNVTTKTTIDHDMCVNKLMFDDSMVYDAK